MKKQVNLNKTVATLVSLYPEIQDILADAGLGEIKNPVALETVGRVMTIPKGAAMKGLDLKDIIRALESAGFEVVDQAEEREGANAKFSDQGLQGLEGDKVAQLKSFLIRLSQGEDLERVREDFVKHFRSVEAWEIAKAEQELIKEGTPVEEVQKLCDLHSALFHGATREEQIAQAELAVTESLKSWDQGGVGLASTKGHPVNILKAENVVVQGLVDGARKVLEGGQDDELVAEADKLRKVAVHYGKKGDLIYPILNHNYDFSGPADVMWGVDNEIRDEFRSLGTGLVEGQELRKRFAAVLDRTEEMVYKEENILWPLCLNHFTSEEWMRIYYDILGYDSLLEGGYPRWEEAEARRQELKTLGGQTAKSLENSGLSHPDQVILGSGTMTPKQILGVLNTVPMELTFVDEEDINRFFSKGAEIFKRPETAIGRDVYTCHPRRLYSLVKSIIESFKAGEKDSFNVWMEKEGRPIYISYLAVRDEEGNYLGTLEAVQDMEFARQHLEGKELRRQGLGGDV